MENISYKKGFMMVEILVAASIITVAILTVMGVAQKSVRLSEQSLHEAQASFLLEEGAEVTRIIRDNNWANISSLTPGTNYYPLFTIASSTWSLSTTVNTVGIFTRKVTLANVNRDNTTNDISATGTNDTGTKLVTVTVSWPEGASTVSRTLSFYITDLFPA